MPDASKDLRDRKEPLGHPGREEPPAQSGRREKKVLPGRREKEAFPDRPASRVRRAQLARPAVSVLQAPRAPPGRPGPAASAGLHALSEPACETKCELICSPAETLVSVTCPGGTIQISKIADSDTATCTGASAPALALCVKQ